MNSNRPSPSTAAFLASTPQKRLLLMAKKEQNSVLSVLSLRTDLTSRIAEQIFIRGNAEVKAKLSRNTNMSVPDWVWSKDKTFLANAVNVKNMNIPVRCLAKSLEESPNIKTWELSLLIMKKSADFSELPTVLSSLAHEHEAKDLNGFNKTLVLEDKKLLQQVCAVMTGDSVEGFPISWVMQLVDEWFASPSPIPAPSA